MLSPLKNVTEGDIVDPVYQQTQADYHYSLGEALSLDGETQKAIEQFKLTLVYDTKSADVRLRLAAEYIKQGLMSEAIEQVEAALEIQPDSLEGRLLLGGLYSSLKMYDVAQKQYEFLMIQYPDNLDVPVYMGALLAEQNKTEQAINVFKDLAAHPKNPKKYKADYYIGRIRSEQKDPKQWKLAEKAYIKGISAKPDDEDLVLALARLYDKMHKPKQAMKILLSYQDRFGPKKEVARTLSVKLLEKEKYDEALQQLEILEGFEGDDLNVKVKISLILIEQKKYDQAIDKLEEIIRMAPESDKIRFYLGAVYEEVKKPELAISHFTKISPSSSYYPEAVIHAAYMYKTLGDIKGAEETVQHGIQAKDDIPQFYAFYASLLDEQKQYKTAINMLEKATKKFPSRPQLEFFLGSMYDRVGKSGKTIEIMKHVLELDANHVQALNYLAYTYADKGINLDAAESLASKAIGLSPNDGYIMDTFGWVLYKQGKYAESIKYLEAAHKNVQSESIISEHLGDAYYRFELLDKAKSMYLNAVAHAQDDDRIRQIKTKLSTIEKQKDLRRPASAAKSKPFGSK